jgi:hypothetical protein
MDIMNNMTVSRSKLTFSLIAISALLISGSGFMIQDAYAAAGIEPTFTAYHNTTTQTDITFTGFVNGTLDIADWRITLDGTSIRPFTDSVTITAILNASSHPSTHYVDNNSNFINHTVGPIYLHHTAIPSDSTYHINFTNSETASGVTHVNGTDGLGFLADINRGENGRDEDFMPTGTSAVAADYMMPTIVSAEILKASPSQIKIKMSETIANKNATFSGFTIATTSYGSYGVANSEPVNSSIATINNGTSYIYVNLNSAVKSGDVFTLAYNTAQGGIIGNYWITDAINSEAHNSHLASSGPHKLGGLGNRLLNVTNVAIVNYFTNYGVVGNLENCYDCSAPVVSKVQVSLDSSMPVTVTDGTQVQINAGIGDTVSVMVTVADNMGADTIPFAGLYTNFGATPDNLFYANNFDSTKQMSTSYYEWNVNTDDIAFDNDGAITWTDATAKVNADSTQTFTYTMTINDSIESSQVWVDLGDKTGNYAKLALPITLEVSGAPAITFASDDSQKVVSFFNESILLAIVSEWTLSSSDDASNVEQLSSVLGIEDQLPTWTTDLASWVAYDKIDVADMIVAVEYVINQ